MSSFHQALSVSIKSELKQTKFAHAQFVMCQFQTSSWEAN